MDFAIRFLAFDDNTYEGSAITQDVLDELVRQIREGTVDSCLLSLQEYPDEDFFTVDIEEGWAALTFNSWDEEGEAHMYMPLNQKYSDVEDEAPVEVGGQSPIPKRYALDDLNLAAECILCFAKTGELYPNVSWENCDD